jgi:3-hydroxyacyl-CoA dehydrogenase
MTSNSMQHLTVLGAGVLGGQIAWQSAFCGKTVVIYDLYEEGLAQCRVALDRYEDIYRKDLGASDEAIQATRDNLSLTTDLAESVSAADFVIEVVPEIVQLKIDFYQELARHLPQHTLIATNSSTLLPSQFAEHTGRPEKYCALHFANLIWAMNVGEVMAHAGTAQQTLEDVTRFAIEIGMVPIPVAKEQNGYVLNSLLVPVVNAALTLLTNGVSTPEYIDRTYMIMNRGCAMGPCGTMDVVGMNTVYNITQHWGSESGDQQMLSNSAYIKEHFLDKGKLGLQSGEGFYQYPAPAYTAADFLDVPDVERAAELALLSKPGS